MKKILFAWLALTVFATAASAASANRLPKSNRSPKSMMTTNRNQGQVDESEYDGMSNPNAMTIELLGRGGYYSLDYDRLLSPNVALGIGLSYTPNISMLFWNADALIIPVYADFYMATEHHRPFITVGADVVLASMKNNELHFNSDGTLTSTSDGTSQMAGGVAAIVGVGYEYRSQGGFIFRAAPYLGIGSGGVAFTGGISAGAAF